jgi:hypothetical protein
LCLRRQVDWSARGKGKKREMGNGNEKGVKELETIHVTTYINITKRIIK